MSGWGDGEGAELGVDRKIRALGTYQVPPLLRVKLWPRHITKYKLNNRSGKVDRLRNLH
jgi:hypothetical protein